jgi:hypothetical protein
MFSKFYLTLLFSVVLLFGCEQKVNETATTPEPKENQKDDSDKLDPLLNKVDEIDQLCETDFIEKRSLLWEKTGGPQSAFVQITSFTDLSGNPYKIIEEYNNGQELAQEGRHIYYLDEGEVIAYFHKYDQWLNATIATLYDEQHFFEKNTGNSILSRKRSSDAEEYLYEEEWETIASAHPDLTRAQSILAAEKPYTTHFLSVIESDYGLFLLLGEPKEASEPRFQTTVVANPEQPFIQDLLRNKDSYKFKKLNINYSFEGGGNDPVFTVLQSAEWVE